MRPELLEEINEKTDIVALVSKYVKLTKAGSDYKGLCPFHEEKTPSFMVSPSKKIAKCMGCGAGGRPITFLSKIKNISIEDAAIELAEELGIKVDRERPKGPDYTKHFEIMKTAASFYHHNLLNTKQGEIALKYLENRGINKDIIEKFNIGLSPEEPNLLYQVLKDSGYNELDMSDLGLIKSSNDGYYDLFTRRIMFPIMDQNSNILGFSARIYVDDKNQAKYVNSPESIIFKKNQVLYNINNAYPFILKRKRIILHEGQMDVIASFKSGLEEVVCTMGTALTKNHIAQIKKYTNDVVLAYDNDNAGVAAMVKAIKLFQNEGVNLKIVRLQNAKDPDEFILKYGVEQYKNFFDNHLVDPYDFLYELATLNKDFSKISQIEDAKNELFSYLILQKSNVLTEKYLEKFAIKTSLNLQNLFNDYKDYANKNLNYQDIDYKEVKKVEKKDSINLSYLKATKRLFDYAKHSKDLALELDRDKFNSIKLIDCLPQEYQVLWCDLANTYYTEYNDFVEGIFLNTLEKKQYDLYLKLKEIEFITPDFSEQDLEDCKNNLYFNHIKKLSQIIEDKFKDESISLKEKKMLTMEKIKYLQLLQKIKKRK